MQDAREPLCCAKHNGLYLMSVSAYGIVVCSAREHSMRWACGASSIGETGADGAGDAGGVGDVDVQGECGPQ